MMSIHPHYPVSHALYLPQETAAHIFHKEPIPSGYSVSPLPSPVTQVTNTMAPGVTPPLGMWATARQELAKGFAAEVGKTLLGSGIIAGGAIAFHSLDR